MNSPYETGNKLIPAFRKKLLTWMGFGKSALIHGNSIKNETTASRRDEYPKRYCIVPNEITNCSNTIQNMKIIIRSYMAFYKGE